MPLRSGVTLSEFSPSSCTPVEPRDGSPMHRCANSRENLVNSFSDTRS